MGRLFFVVGIAAASALGISGCGSKGETIAGGSTIGTIGGAAAGGIIGHEVGERYEERNRRR